MINKFRRLKIYTQIIILSYFTILIFLVFVFSFGQKTMNTFRETNEYYTNEVIDQLEETIYSNYNALCSILRFISFQSNIQTFLLETEGSSKYDLYKPMQRDLSSALNLNSQILDIVVLDSIGNIYRITNVEYSLPSFDLTSSGIQLSPLIEDDSIHMDYFVLSSNITSTSLLTKTNQPIGSIHLILNKNAFSEGTSNSVLQTKSKLYLCDVNEHFFWGNNPAEYPDMKKFSNKEYKKTNLSDLDLSIISIMEKDETIYSILNTQVRYYFTLLLILLVVITLWILFIRNLVTPLNYLVKFITGIKEGVLKDLNRRVQLTGYHEIEVICTEFNGMLSTIDQLTHQILTTATQLYEAKILKNQAEMQSLRSQINPHFLYNTLESIKGIAAQQQQSEIIAITKSLATIFKYSVKGSPTVTLKDELKIITNYISIQLVRFENRFHVDYDIQEECLDCVVPKMILQPIIENAIVHGIELMKEDSQLLVRAYKDEREELAILVFNESTPIEPQLLEDLQTSLATAYDAFSGDDSNKSIGIYNVNSRIKLSYGNEYGLQIASNAKGTTVTFHLPYLTT